MCKETESGRSKFLLSDCLGKEYNETTNSQDGLDIKGKNIMQNCGYCQGRELLAKFGIEICDLDVSQLILFKEQSHPGRRSKSCKCNS